VATTANRKYSIAAWEASQQVTVEAAADILADGQCHQRRGCERQDGTGASLSSRTTPQILDLSPGVSGSVQTRAISGRIPWTWFVNGDDHGQQPDGWQDAGNMETQGTGSILSIGEFHPS